jgi:hypothetical protein
MLVEEMAKNRTNTEARFKEKARKEKEADDEEEKMLKEQMLMNEVDLSESKFWFFGFNWG